MARNDNTRRGRADGLPISVPAAVGLGVVLVLAFWFILMNTADTHVHLWGFSVVSMPLWLVLVLLLFFGALLGWGGARWWDRRNARP